LLDVVLPAQVPFFVHLAHTILTPLLEQKLELVELATKLDGRGIRKAELRSPIGLPASPRLKI
jgi:hypothetical protein